ncbi:MAG: selenium cofactor biosynthesis protein YqeC [Dehalococcoidia bacterium]|nr:selenium cofactor biosynthesis protein YqeC [Dehalococcoidia bacterium]
MIAVNDLWHEIYPYLAAHASEFYGRADGHALELGPFAGGMSCALSVSHPHMHFTIADSHNDYMSHIKRHVSSCNLSSRMHIVETALDRLLFADGSFDLVMFRGAYFFIMERPHILQEIYRVLALGGVAFVGGGYGRNTPQGVIDTIADESRVLNEKLGRQRITLEQLRALLRSQNMESVARITEEGGIWLIIHKRKQPVEKQSSSLSESLGLEFSENIALVGGGGKTSLMFRLAQELAGNGQKVISTTTTHIFPPSCKETPCLIVESEEDALVERLTQELPIHKHVTLALALDNNGKLKGLSPEILDKIQALDLADYIVNEADGAAGKPIKAPRHGEPVIPTSTTLVLALVGLDALGAPLSTEKASRIEFIERLAGLSLYDIMTDEVIATLLTEPNGIIQNTPPNARIVPFLNKSDLVSTEAVESLASAILARRHMQINQVVAGSLSTQLSLYRIFHSSIFADGGNYAE